MPRDIPVGNGALLVNFDDRYLLRDIYWPHVGQENHTQGHPFRFGVWVDGTFRWVSDDGGASSSAWQRELDYADDTLVTHVTLYHPDLALRIVCQDIVDFHEDLYLRKVVVHNEVARDRAVRLFFAQDLRIGGNAVGDTVYYEPERRAVFHYKGQRWFLINTMKEGAPEGVDQWAVGVKEAQGKEGTWRDAEDGSLSGNAVAQGSVDSVVGIELTVPAAAEATAWYWIAVGDCFQVVTGLNRAVRQKGPETFLKRTHDYWSFWVSQGVPSFLDLPPKICQLYQRSLMILRTQIDDGGAVLAANDFDIAHYGRDTYSYMWPRDGALVTSALIQSGFPEVTRRFFDFCHRVITEDGYLLHKYNPDGALGSSWHGWYYEGEKSVPVQEDETALVLWALWRHFDRFHDVEFIKPHYRGLVIRAANWMCRYRDETSGLPLPSWDLWEERWGVHAWTVGATWAGLQAAANFADAFGEADLAARYRSVADEEIKPAVEEHLWSSELGRYVRTIRRDEDGHWDSDSTVDASLFGLWYFGMFDADDPRIVATMEAVRDRLWLKTEVGGVARYEDDHYHQVSDDIERVPGNPWFICTLWLAQWIIARAETDEGLEPALELVRWAVDHSLRSGVMAEQVHPHTNEPLSVSPLTWSHGTLVMTIQEYLDKHAHFHRCPECGHAPHRSAVVPSGEVDTDARR